MVEIWKPIKNFETYYEISNLGNVKSNKYISKILKPFKNSKGYLYVNLINNRKRKTISIHRLVALTFISNPENKPQINHKDCNKLNNCVSNLEWCNNSENTKHAYDNQLRFSTGYKIIQYDLNYNKLNEFKSMLEASNITNISYNGIRLCCLQKRKTSGGYIWKFM